MTEAGMARIEEAKQNGQWEAAYRLKKGADIPEDLQTALQADGIAWENFRNMANSYKSQAVYWISQAKRRSTRDKRIQQTVEKAHANKKIYES